MKTEKKQAITILRSVKKWNKKDGTIKTSKSINIKGLSVKSDFEDKEQGYIINNVLNERYETLETELKKANETIKELTEKLAEAEAIDTKKDYINLLIQANERNLLIKDIETQINELIENTIKETINTLTETHKQTIKEIKEQNKKNTNIVISAITETLAKQNILEKIFKTETLNETLAETILKENVLNLSNDIIINKDVLNIKDIILSSNNIDLNKLLIDLDNNKERMQYITVNKDNLE